MLHKPKPDSTYIKYMPPLVGSEEEVLALAKYLGTLSIPKEPAKIANK